MFLFFTFTIVETIFVPHERILTRAE